jgi:hypothetical protein
MRSEISKEGRRVVVVLREVSRIGREECDKNNIERYKYRSRSRNRSGSGSESGSRSGSRNRSRSEEINVRR